MSQQLELVIDREHSDGEHGPDRMHSCDRVPAWNLTDDLRRVGLTGVEKARAALHPDAQRGDDALPAA